MNRFVITGLRLEQFRKFGGAVQLAGLGPGLNLLSAPNEAGKSTLKKALDSVFFTRHRVGGQAADDLRTAGNDVSPVVQVNFELAGESYTLTKRFWRQQRARLVRPDGSLTEGDPAEEELQALLGFESVGARGAKAEALGIWGLLWVEQGQSFTLPEVSGSARGSLEECLADGEVAAITGGQRGHRVAERVRAELARYVTAGRGQPSGRYAQVLKDLAEAETALKAGRALKDELAGQLEQLEASRRDLAHETRDFDPQAEEAELAALRKQLGEAQQLAQQAQNAKLATDLARSAVERAETAAHQRQEMTTAAAAKAEALAKAEAEAAAATEAVKQAAARLAEAEKAYRAADEAWKHADRAAEALAARDKAARQASQSAERQRRLEQALAAARAATETRRQAETLKATDAAVAKLRQLAGERDRAAAARTAAATVLRFSLTGEGAAALRLNGENVDADAEVALTRPAALDLGPLGQVEIRPGVQDAAAIDQALADAEAKVQKAFEVLAVASLAEAETQNAQRRAFAQEAEAKANEARLYAPDLDGNAGRIVEALETVKAEAALAAAALEAAAADDGEPVSEDEANATLRQAGVVRQAAGDALAAARQAHALAQQSAGQADKALSDAKAAATEAARMLEAARAASSDEALAGQVVAAREALAEAECQHEAIKGKAASAGAPDRIDSQIKRLERARSERDKRIAGLRVGIATLEAEVRAKAERGPDEAIAEAEARLERLSVEKARIERDLAALQLLDRTLKDAQASVEAQYLRPVTAKLRPHLAALFGEADIGLGGDFSLQTLRRANRAEDVGQLSAGTQEQLAILSRLAFAEVLAEQGRPVVLVLDDALAFSDDRRIQDMFSALERAAERFQVIVLTCRQRVFDGLGGENQRRLSVEACGPIEL